LPRHAYIHIGTCVLLQLDIVVSSLVHPRESIFYYVLYYLLCCSRAFNIHFLTLQSVASACSQYMLVSFPFFLLFFPLKWIVLSLLFSDFRFGRSRDCSFVLQSRLLGGRRSWRSEMRCRSPPMGTIVTTSFSLTSVGRGFGWDQDAIMTRISRYYCLQSNLILFCMFPKCNCLQAPTGLVTSSMFTRRSM